MLSLQLQFGGIFDGDDTMFFGNPLRQSVKKRGLPRPGSAVFSNSRNLNIYKTQHTPAMNSSSVVSSQKTKSTIRWLYAPARIIRRDPKPRAPKA
jgi:hypothetical protein